jgi:phosphopantothenoylcysteine decarboxylase / phosphopantothenate---cysteine ligase
MTPFDWDFQPPQSTPLGDHEVPRVSDHLVGRRIALLVCGGIAAMKTPFVARALRRRGADVVAFCSEEALRYVGREALEWSTVGPVITRLTWEAEHLSDARPFDAYLVAPATYNTLGKTAAGIADTVVTAALASAFGRLQEGRTRILFAPTLHGSMHHDLLIAACRRLADLGARFIPPRDDYGKHNLPDEEFISAAVCRAITTSRLRARRILVAGGRLGATIHEELLLRGADSRLLLQAGGWRPAPWIPGVSGDGAGVDADSPPRDPLFEERPGTDAWLDRARERLASFGAVIAVAGEGGAHAPPSSWLVTAGGLQSLRGIGENPSALVDFLEEALD